MSSVSRSVDLTQVPPTRRHSLFADAARPLGGWCAKTALIGTLALCTIAGAPKRFSAQLIGSGVNHGEDARTVEAKHVRPVLSERVGVLDLQLKDQAGSPVVNADDVGSRKEFSRWVEGDGLSVTWADYRRHHGAYRNYLPQIFSDFDRERALEPYVLGPRAAEVSQLDINGGACSDKVAVRTRSRLNQYVRALSYLKRTLRCIGGKRCGFGSLHGGTGVSRSDTALANGDPQSPPHEFRLSVHGPELKGRQNNKAASENGDPPIGRRFAIAIVAWIIADHVNRVGYSDTERRRPLRGRILVGTSILIFGAGYGLFVLTGLIGRGVGGCDCANRIAAKHTSNRVRMGAL